MRKQKEGARDGKKELSKLELTESMRRTGSRLTAPAVKFWIDIWINGSV